jgi:twitching motility protein PilT
MLRHDGKLEPMKDEQVMSVEFLQELTRLFLPEAAQAVFATQKHVAVAYALGSRARFRVHVSLQKGYPTFDLRYIPLQVPAAATLGIPKHLIELSAAREGLVLITGPRGSGRTTTVAALIDHINHSASKHIVTLEGPVEYQIANDRALIEQRAIGEDVVSLSEALADLRQEDVDVVAIDVPLPPSAWPDLAKLAGAGTLVLVVVEADSAVRALEYLTSPWPGVQPQVMQLLLAETLLGVTCQRLLPKLGGGRVLASELLLGTQPVKSLIHEGRVHQVQSTLETSREEGMVVLERVMAALVRQGDVVREEALAQAVHPEALESLLKAK